MRGREQRSLTSEGGEDTLACGRQLVWVGVGWTPIGMRDFAGVMDDVTEDVEDLTCRLQTDDTMPSRFARGRHDRHSRYDLLLSCDELQQPEPVDKLQTLEVRAGLRG